MIDPVKYKPYLDDEEEARDLPDFDDPVDATGHLLDQQPAYNKIINAEVCLPQFDTYRRARVVGQTVGPDGQTVGMYNKNPILNTMDYDVEFPYGKVCEYSANVIAENLLAQVDDEGYFLQLLDAITDYRKDGMAVEKQETYGKTCAGNHCLCKTTCGWHLQVLWKDRSTAWIPLKEIKESHPVETAEFAVTRNISNKPAFEWWVPYTLRKRNVIISAVKTHIRKMTTKYGIKVPLTVNDAYALDASNGNDFWRQAIAKERQNVGVTFKILNDDAPLLIGWRKASGHLIFDIKTDFTHKARWVLDGHCTPTPAYSMFAGVVSCESVRIALTYAALNNLDICAADIQNAYLQVPSSEKFYVICGLEFGLENVGKHALIRQALYGGKSAGCNFRNHLHECMSFLGFQSCRTDPDVWMREATKSDGSQYWEYVLLYVDNTLVVSDRGKLVLRNEIGKYFTLKESSIGPPSLYLGGHMRKVTMTNGASAWAFSSLQYVQEAVRNVEEALSQQDKKLPTQCNSPMSSNYCPETDTLPELPPQDASYFQLLIGILRWIVELGWVDICLEVSMLSSHLVLP